MESRMERYNHEDNNKDGRSKRNEELYEKNYNPFDDLDSAFTFEWEKEFLITEENYPKNRMARHELDKKDLDELPKREPVNIDEIQYKTRAENNLKTGVVKSEQKMENLPNMGTKTDNLKKETTKDTVKSQQLNESHPKIKQEESNPLKEVVPPSDIVKKEESLLKSVDPPEIVSEEEPPKKKPSVVSPKPKPKPIKVEEVFPMMTAEEKERKKNLNIKIIVGMIFLINTIIIICLLIMSLYL